MFRFKDYIQEDNKHYEDAEEHLSKANDAEAKGDMKSFHAHMADHHDCMSEWHDSKGRSASADKHAEKAEMHHEKSLSVKEESTPYWKKPSFNKRMSQMAKQERKERERKAAEQKPVKEEAEQIDELSKDTVARYKEKASRALDWAKSRLTRAIDNNEYKDSMDASRVVDNRKQGLKKADQRLKEGLKPEHNMRPGWMIKGDPELAKKVDANKKKYQEFRKYIGKKVEKESK